MINKVSTISEVCKTSRENSSKLKELERGEYREIDFNLKQILEIQKVNRKDLHLGFIVLASQNNELLKLNERLVQKLEIVEKELYILKKEREEKAARKEARAKRKRLPRRDPITPRIYKLLLEAAGGPNYTSVRLRIAFCLLTVTGIRINELLPLKVSQLQTLLEEHWIGIDRSKRGPGNHKAFLTREGERLVKERKKDFDFLFLMKHADSYIFTSELNHSKMLSRETITRDMNRVMRSISKTLTDQPNITSHSFRVGYISKLWKDTKDIEFVRQSIGHKKINSTSSYVEKLSDRERQERMLRIYQKDA